MTEVLDRASSLHRRQLCKGSFRAEHELRNRESEIAKMGSRKHKLVGTGDYKDATPEEIEECTDVSRMAIQVEEDVIGDGKILQRLVERDMHVYHESKPVLICHPDAVIIFEEAKTGEKAALIEDWKFGFLEVDSAEENIQLLAYAVAVWGEFGVKRVYSRIIQRFAKKEDHKVAFYDEAALIEGHAVIMEILEASQVPDAPRTPSEPACRYCRALGTLKCPETTGIVEILANEVVVVTTPEQMAARLELFSIAKAIIKKDSEDFETFAIANPGAIPNWWMKPGNILDKLPDAQKAWDCVSDIFTVEQFQACCNVAKGKLEDMLKLVTGLKGMKLDAEFDRRMEPAIVKQQNAPSLAKISKKQLKDKEAK